MKIGYLSKRSSLKLIEKLRELDWTSSLAEKRVKSVLQLTGEGFTIYKVHGFLLAEKGGRIFPTIHEEHNRRILDSLPSIIVDMGAVPYVARGADVMRPGIREFRGSFRRGGIVVIRDEKNLKPLSISLALKDSDKCLVMEKGKVAENLHHVNDRIWKAVQAAKHLLDRD